MSEGHPATRQVSYQFLTPLILILVAMVAQSRLLEDRITIWLLNAVLMAAFVTIAGRGITGYWRGILIDNRNRMSLSRLQMLCWTLLILSAVLTAAITNFDYGAPASSVDIQIPNTLLTLMGISTISMLAAPAVLSSKKNIQPDKQEREDTSDAMKSQGHDGIDDRHNGLVIRNHSAAGAKWADLLKGEEFGNGSTVDLGKLQMFLFTFVLAGAYASALAALFREGEMIVALPSVEDGMNTLLGISQTGYLAAKALPHSRTSVDESDTETKPPTGRKTGTTPKSGEQA